MYSMYIYNVIQRYGDHGDGDDGGGTYGRSLLDGTMSTRHITSALQMPSTHPATRNANHRENYLLQFFLNTPFSYEG